MKKHSFIITITIFYLLFCIVLNPSIYLQQTFDGITAWAINVLPSLLPFVVFTKLLSAYGDIGFLTQPFSKPMKSFYKTPKVSAYVFFMSIVSGYPVGAKITSDLYSSGQIFKSDAFKIMSFCSTSGPMFIIGAVGIKMLKNATFGYMIFFSHVLGALINGLLYRNIKIKDKEKPSEYKTYKKQDFSDIILDSCLSIISVGAIIAIFFVVIQSFSPIFNFFPQEVSSILSGCIEITKGCLDISSCLTGTKALLASTFIISFGGLSTIIQSLTMLNKIKMPIWLFALQKATHAILATIICFVISLIVL